MRGRSYSDEGIVLAKRSFGEADRIISLYTKSHGRVSYVAKGIRRPLSRKRGHIEVFNQIRLQASVGRGIDILTEAEIINSFPEIRVSLKRVSLAYYFMEVVGRMTREHEANQELYELIYESLDKLNKTRQLKKLRLEFVVNVLTLLGFWPKGKKLISPDVKLEEVIERSIASVRVGKRMLK